jgi:hypothetical protein
MAYGNLQPKRVKLANMFEATKILRKKSEKAKKSSNILLVLHFQNIGNRFKAFV